MPDSVRRAAELTCLHMRVMPIRFLLASVLISTQCIADEQLAIDWSWGSTLPIAQTALGTGAADDRVFVVGGTYWIGSAELATDKVWSMKVHQLDTRSQRWSALPDYPLGVGYPLVVGAGTTLWVIGGRDAQHTHAATHTLDLSQSHAGWVPGPDLPQPRFAARGGMINGTLYVAAGTEQRDGEYQPAQEVLALDTSNAKSGWQVVARLPGSNTEWQTGAVCSGKLYLFGGLVDPKGAPETPESFVRASHQHSTLVPRSESYVFDPANNQLRTLQPLPAPVGSGVAVAIDDHRIVIAGGLALAVPATNSADGRNRTYFTSQCLVYNTASDRYTVLASSPSLGRLDQGGAFVNGSLYIVGGEESAWKTRTDLVQIGKLR